jgi:carboxymethylenebutenolidase
MYFGQVGVTGFCMGGALSFASAVLVPGIDAIVAFYGTPPPQLADPAESKVPVQAHFGEEDTMKGLSDKEVSLLLFSLKHNIAARIQITDLPMLPKP